MKRTSNYIACLIVITAVLLCLAGVSRAYANRGQETPVGKAADFFVRPVQSMFTHVREKAANWVSDITDAKKLRAENEELKNEIARKDYDERKLTSLQEENRRLSALLQMQQSRNEFHTVACRVIAKDAAVASGAFQIDKGKRAGIRSGNAVVHSSGLVGKVTAVHENSAQVLPITEPDNAVGARLVRNQALGVLEGHTKGTLTFSCFSEDSLPVQGDEAETSGVGGVYPAGILIGTVTRITKEIIEVTPTVNMKTLQEVLVVIEKP